MGKKAILNIISIDHNNEQIIGSYSEEAYATGVDDGFSLSFSRSSGG